MRPSGGTSKETSVHCSHFGAERLTWTIVRDRQRRLSARYSALTRQAATIKVSFPEPVSLGRRLAKGLHRPCAISIVAPLAPRLGSVLIHRFDPAVTPGIVRRQPSGHRVLHSFQNRSIGATLRFGPSSGVHTRSRLRSTARKPRRTVHGDALQQNTRTRLFSRTLGRYVAASIPHFISLEVRVTGKLCRLSFLTDLRSRTFIAV